MCPDISVWPLCCSSGCYSHRPAGSGEDNEDGKQGEGEDERRGGERSEAKEGRGRGEKGWVYSKYLHLFCTRRDKQSEM